MQDKLEKLTKYIEKSLEQEVEYLKLESAKEFTTDKLYYNLITDLYNGGYFFKNSLHIYGYCHDLKYHDCLSVNQIIKSEFKEIIGNLFCFAQDIFGNQFGFENQKVFMFNIETGEKTFIADNFTDWIEVLFNDLDYLTGQSFVNQSEKLELIKNRLCPKKPFVIGGNYSIDNFYLLPFPEYIKVNANIAQQVYNLKDGTEIKIKTVP